MCLTIFRIGIGFVLLFVYYKLEMCIDVDLWIDILDEVVIIFK